MNEMDWIDDLEEKKKEIERLTAESTEFESRCYHYQDIINKLEIEANKNIQVCNNRGFNFISSIDEVKSLDDFEFNEYIGYLVSLELLDKLQELKGDSCNE